MTNLKRICLALVVCGLVVPGIAKDKKPVESRPLATPIQVDANPAEWPADEPAAREGRQRQLRLPERRREPVRPLPVQRRQGHELGRSHRPDALGQQRRQGKEELRPALRPENGGGRRSHQDPRGRRPEPDRREEEGIHSRPSYRSGPATCSTRRASRSRTRGSAAGRSARARPAKTRSTSSSSRWPCSRIRAPRRRGIASNALKVDFEWGGLTEDMKRAQAGNLGDASARASGAARSLLADQRRRGPRISSAQLVARPDAGRSRPNTRRWISGSTSRSIQAK